ncbi:MAG: hypothetical protein KDJ73_02685 [Notoacmeibacter sp.]|nr:hypothetical protein [Notoacmeibacter sp.]MCC0032068.1 hypothetical protein [Brucellaceae bacterium]
MKPMNAIARPRISGLALLAVTLGLLTGLALAGWIAMGPDMFMALIQNGLATCF